MISFDVSFVSLSNHYGHTRPIHTLNIPSRPHSSFSLYHLILSLTLPTYALLQSNQARHHWLPGDGYHLRRGWLLGFMIFNAVLYSTQVSLYSLLFFPQVSIL